MLGVAYGKVKLAPPSPNWQTYFQSEAHILYQAIKSYVMEIRHIGSTAIPGIWAKPIIDIMAGLENLADIQFCVPLLKSVGYNYMGEQPIPGWHFFIKGHGEIKTHHLHVVEWESDYWVSHLLFMNYLCQHQEVAAAYEELKLELAKKYPNDRESYTRDKGYFIKAILEMALLAECYPEKVKK